MGTALIYLVVLLVVAALFFAVASAVFGRGEELAPIPPGATPTWLPEEVRAEDVRAVRFQQVVRGYKMAEVDWVLERLAGELDRCELECDGLRRRIVDLESAVAGAKQADVVGLVTSSVSQQPASDPAGGPSGRDGATEELG
jgi:DivIVA domain-containing protein